MADPEESYGRAIQSSNLKITENPDAAGKLIAAGWSDRHHGAMLLRLRIEFDSARQRLLRQHRQVAEAGERARRITDESAADISRTEKAARGDETPVSKAEIDKAKKDRAEQMRSEAQVRASSERVMIYAELRTLPIATRMLEDFGRVINDRERTKIPNPEIRRIAEAVIDSWLDTKCHECNGLGFTGGYTGPALRCNACRQTGSRKRAQFAKSQEAQQLAYRLLDACDQVSADAQSRMARLWR